MTTREPPPAPKAGRTVEGRGQEGRRTPRGGGTRYVCWPRLQWGLRRGSGTQDLTSRTFETFTRHARMAHIADQSGSKHKRPPRKLPERPRTAHKRSETVQEATTIAQDGPDSRPKLPKKALRAPLNNPRQPSERPMTAAENTPPQVGRTGEGMGREGYERAAGGGEGHALYWPWAPTGRAPRRRGHCPGAQLPLGGQAGGRCHDW